MNRRNRKSVFLWATVSGIFAFCALVSHFPGPLLGGSYKVAYLVAMIAASALMSDLVAFERYRLRCVRMRIRVLGSGCMAQTHPGRGVQDDDCMSITGSSTVAWFYSGRKPLVAFVTMPGDPIARSSAVPILDARDHLLIAPQSPVESCSPLCRIVR